MQRYSSASSPSPSCAACRRTPRRSRSDRTCRPSRAPRGSSPRECAPAPRCPAQIDVCCAPSGRLRCATPAAAAPALQWRSDSSGPCGHAASVGASRATGSARARECACVRCVRAATVCEGVGRGMRRDRGWGMQGGACCLKCELAELEGLRVLHRLQRVPNPAPRRESWKGRAGIVHREAGFPNGVQSRCPPLCSCKHSHRPRPCPPTSARPSSGALRRCRPGGATLLGAARHHLSHATGASSSFSSAGVSLSSSSTSSFTRLNIPPLCTECDVEAEPLPCTPTRRR